MSGQQGQKYNDGLADAVCATAVIVIVVAAVTYWLCGMPG